MKGKQELEQLIQNQNELLHTNISDLIKEEWTSDTPLPHSVDAVISNKAELINELNANIKMAELVKYEVNSGTKRINTFLRLEGITNEAVIYNFIKKDSDFKSISSKVAYGSYKTINMTKALLQLTLNKFEEKGY